MVESGASSAWPHNPIKIAHYCSAQVCFGDTLIRQACCSGDVKVVHLAELIGQAFQAKALPLAFGFI